MVPPHNATTGMGTPHLYTMMLYNQPCSMSVMTDCTQMMMVNVDTSTPNLADR